VFDDTETVEVDIICTYIRSSDRAILIEVDGEQDWIPKSQIIDASVDLDDLEKGDPVTITIPEWLAEEKVLI